MKTLRDLRIKLGKLLKDEKTTCAHAWITVINAMKPLTKNDIHA